MLTSQGIGSGLDIAALVSQLVAAEGQPTTARLDRREQEVQADLSGLGLLSSALAGFGGKLTALADSATFEQRAVTLSDEGFFAATANTSAAAGSYSVEVTQLAQAQKLVSAGYADADAVVGTGSLTIVAGGTALQVTIDSSSNTLAGIRDAINTAAAGEGVNATLVNVDDGQGGTVSKLLLSAVEPGSANTISVVVSDDDGNDTDTAGLSALAYQAGGTQNLTQTQAARDAIIAIDGQTVTRSSNTIDDAIDGLTLNLTAASAGTKVTVQVAVDTAKVTNEVTQFVAAYNDLASSMGDLSRFDQESGQAGLLLGDATLRSVQRGLRSLLFGNLDAGTLDNLTALGITSNADGTLTLDTAVLQKVAAEQPADLQQLFSGEEGLATRLKALTDDYAGANGSITQRTSGLQETVSRIGDQRDQLGLRLARLESRLQRQFNAMDALIGTLSATSNALTAQLASLPGFSRQTRNNG